MRHKRASPCEASHRRRSGCGLPCRFSSLRFYGGYLAPKLARQRWSMEFVSDFVGSGKVIRMLTIVGDRTRECRIRGLAFRASCDDKKATPAPERFWRRCARLEGIECPPKSPSNLAHGESTIKVAIAWARSELKSNIPMIVPLAWTSKRLQVADGADGPSCLR